MKTNAEKLESLLRITNSNFKTLRPESGIYTVPIRVTNYSEALYLASDIMKLCIIAMEADWEGLTSSTLLNTRVNLSSMLEIALQLLPIEEMEVLDELQLLLREQKESENNR